MRVKLIKINGEYLLNPSIVGTKLSLKNCEAIANGYDLDELAREDTGDIRAYSNYIKGFQKALEILGDKKFSEEDIKKAILFGDGIDWFDEDGNPILAYIESLQQTEWDCIVEMEDATVVHFGGDNEIISRPKLDAGGCLILKRK